MKNQVLQLGLNEKKLAADLSKIRAEVSEIMSRIPVNNAQRRKIIADAFETELLNEYYYSNGRVPGANQVTNLFNELRAKSQDLIGVFLGRKSWDSLIR